MVDVSGSTFSTLIVQRRPFRRVSFTQSSLRGIPPHCVIFDGKWTNGTNRTNSTWMFSKKLDEYRRMAMLNGTFTTTFTKKGTLHRFRQRRGTVVTRNRSVWGEGTRKHTAATSYDTWRKTRNTCGWDRLKNLMRHLCRWTGASSQRPTSRRHHHQHRRDGSPQSIDSCPPTDLQMTILANAKIRRLQLRPTRPEMPCQDSQTMPLPFLIRIRKQLGGWRVTAQ